MGLQSIDTTEHACTHLHSNNTQFPIWLSSGSINFISLDPSAQLSCTPTTAWISWRIPIRQTWVHICHQLHLLKPHEWKHSFLADSLHVRLSVPATMYLCVSYTHLRRKIAVYKFPHPLKQLSIEPRLGFTHEFSRWVIAISSPQRQPHNSFTIGRRESHLHGVMWMALGRLILSLSLPSHISVQCLEELVMSWKDLPIFDSWLCSFLWWPLAANSASWISVYSKKQIKIIWTLFENLKSLHTYYYCSSLNQPLKTFYLSEPSFNFKYPGER